VLLEFGVTSAGFSEPAFAKEGAAASVTIAGAM
jgi:hypothetical protein